MAFRSIVTIRQTMAELAKNKSTSFQVLQNEVFSQEIGAMAKNHFMYLAFIFFKKHIEETLFDDPRIKGALRQMLVIFGLEQIHLNATPLQESRYLGRGQYGMSVAALDAMIKKVREQAIPLVEAAGFEPVSAIGNKYGDIYET